MRAFAVAQPHDLAEAIALLAREPAARLLAGGTDLIIGLRDGSIQTPVVIDIKRIRELDASIVESDGGIVVGARTAMTEIVGFPLPRHRACHRPSRPVQIPQRDRVLG